MEKVEWFAVTKVVAELAKLGETAGHASADKAEERVSSTQQRGKRGKNTRF